MPDVPAQITGRPSKQAKEAASLFFPAEWSEQEARAKAANALQAAYATDYPALLEQARSEVEGEVLDLRGDLAALCESARAMLDQANLTRDSLSRQDLRAFDKARHSLEIDLAATERTET